MFRVKIRVTSDSPEHAERAREYLEGQLVGLSLQTAREGKNPRYARNQKCLAYGDLDVPERVKGESGRLKTEDVEPRRRRKRNPASPAAQPSKPPAPAGDSPKQLAEARRRIVKSAKVSGKDWEW